jgi:hypothetical protein
MDEAGATMNRRIMIILGLVFVALVVVTILQSQPKPIEIAPDERFASFLGRDLNMTVLDIQAIRLRDPQTDQSFVISRDASGNWTAPNSEGSLDTVTASNIAKTVVVMPYQQSVIVTDATNLEQYGFQPNGILSIEVVLADGNGHVIAAGGLTPDGYQYYVLVDEQPRLYLIERGAVDYLLAQLVQPPLT